MRQLLKISIIGILLTFMTIWTFGQCNLLHGTFEVGHQFKKNVRHAINSEKKLKENDLISLLKVDSVETKNGSSYLVAIVFNDEPRGQMDVEFQFQNQKRIKTSGQRPKLSQIDAMYFEDNELLFPITKDDFEIILNSDIVTLQIIDDGKHYSRSPKKTLLKELAKCLM